MQISFDEKGLAAIHRGLIFKPVKEKFMLTKIYTGLWIVVALTAGVTYLSGNLNMLVAVVFGFICFGMVFMGMMSVLPSTVTHSRPVPHSGTVPKIASPQSNLPERVRDFSKAWLSTNGVEVRKPKYH